MNEVGEELADLRLIALFIWKILQSALVVRRSDPRRLPTDLLHGRLSLPYPPLPLMGMHKSFAGAEPGIRSEVGAGLAFRRQVSATSGLGFAPRSGLGGPMPNRFFVC